MIDNEKTKAQLIKELTDLRKRNAELNAIETERKKTEEKLIEHWHTFTAITRNIPDIIYRLDQKGVITYISDVVTQYGYSIEELVGRNILEIICPDDKEKAMYRVNERRTGDRRTISFKIRLLKKDYTSISSEVELKGIESEAVFLIYAEGLYSTDKPEKKSFIGTQGVARDITERIQIEDELKKAKEYLQNIIESSLDMIVTVDKNRHIVEFNKAAIETFGYTKEEIIGKHVHVLYTNEQEGGKVSKMVLKNGVYTGEIQNVRKNGEVFTSFLSAAVMHNENGEIIGTVGNSRDITDLKKAENELRVSMDNFRSIFDNASDAIFVHDAETGEILDANQRTYEMYGFTIEEIRRLKAPCLSSGDHPYSQRDALRWIKKAVKGKSQLFEWQAKDKNGRLFWVEVNLKRTVIGGADRVLAIARDITERKRAEEAVQKSETLYRKTIDLMGDIIHVIDCDFKILFINVKYFNMCKELNIETDVIGKYLFEVCPFLIDKVQNEYYSVFDTGKDHISENEFIIGGRKIITETRKIPVLEDDEVKRIVTVIRDITESKNIENKLKKSQEQLRSLTEYLDMVREKERTTIARDIHDDFGQALTTFKIDLSSIEK